MPLLHEINMGATAIGTGINAPAQYAPLVCKNLSELTNIPFETAPNLIEATQDAGVFVQLSGSFATHRCKIIETCNDLRFFRPDPIGIGESRFSPNVSRIQYYAR